MNYLIVVLAIATFFSTLIGGAIIVKFRKSLPYFFAFAAGAIIAVAFLDLMPEALEISKTIDFPVRDLMIIIVVSFFIYSLIDKYFLTHNLDECDECEHGHIMGPIGAGSLVIHSFLDGAAIATAFQVNAAVGLVVALAVICHDFTDGINTVTVMLKNKQKVKNAVYFLIMDAIAPVLGVVVISFLHLSELILVILLGVFIGEFLYLGAANLLPETHKYPSKKLLIAMAIGIILIIILTSLI
jgi:zinc transporter ZupT